MKDPKFTDEEVIQALKCCADKTSDCCASCPCQAKGLNEGPDCIPAVCQAALDLINRQKAEVVNEVFDEVLKKLFEMQKRYEKVGHRGKAEQMMVAREEIFKLQKKFTEEKTDGSM